MELPFVFHTATLGGFNYTKDELQLSNNMLSYWTNFAHHGDPNGAAVVGRGRRRRGGRHYQQGQKGAGSLLTWPQYNGSDQGKCMRFKTPDSGVSCSIEIASSILCMFVDWPWTSTLEML